MENKQYIGARYVPRFTGVYDNTQAYEALDVVDNGSGTTYIAKIPVPPNTPLTDTTYWLVYGSSSGAILDLQTRMGAAEGDISNIQLDISALQGSVLGLDNRMGAAEGDITNIQLDISALQGSVLGLKNRVSAAEGDITNLQTWMGTAEGNITNLQTAVNKRVKELKERYFLFIGDSFDNFTENSWVNRVVSVLNLSRYYNACRATAGFSGVIGMTYASYFPSLVIPDETEITDIVIAAGANDIPASGSVDETLLTDAINNFLIYLRARFTGVKRIYIGQIALKMDTSQKYLNTQVVTNVFKDRARQKGLIYLNNVEYCLYYTPYIGGDFIHPTANGVIYLGNNISEAIINGSTDVTFKRSGNATLFTTGDITASGTLSINVAFKNGRYQYNMEFKQFIPHGNWDAVNAKPFMQFNPRTIPLPLYHEHMTVIYDMREYFDNNRPNPCVYNYIEAPIYFDASTGYGYIHLSCGSDNTAFFNTVGQFNYVEPLF